MKMPDHINSELLAPCGMNCLVCYVHLKDKKPCSGCRAIDDNKTERCKSCKIKKCAIEKSIRYCFECIDFPCMQIKNLDKSYIKRYNTSLIENSQKVQTDGIYLFMKSEHEKWICRNCSGVISLHDSECSNCKTKYLVKDKK